jgi:hypothetical protein
MKKIIIIFFVFNALLSFAQNEDLKNKNGKLILPLEGEIGLGINAVPLLNWVGNSFNNTADNLYASNNKLYNLNGSPIVLVKFMKTNNLAYRFSFGYSNFSGIEKEYVLDDSANSSDEFLFDSRQRNFSVFSLGLGFEKRKGRGRVQGFYGAEFRYQSMKVVNDIFTYSNNLTLTNQNPTSYDWSTNSVESMTNRVLETIGGNSYSIGIRPFVGVEVFVSPQISLGTEFGWAYAYQKTSSTSVYVESFSASSNKVVYEDIPQSAGSSSFSSQLDNFNSSIFMTLYF